MNSNQTENIKDELKRIEAKQTLGLPLSDRDSAILTLYGQPATTADAAPSDDAVQPEINDEVVKQICADIVAPIIDVLTPAVKAVAYAIRAGVK